MTHHCLTFSNPKVLNTRTNTDTMRVYIYIYTQELKKSASDPKNKRKQR